MALDFPNSPVDGQVYDNYFWDAATNVWRSSGSTSIPDFLTNATISTASLSDVPLRVDGIASQAANLQEWRNSSGTVLASMSASGGLTLNNALTVGNGGTGATSLTLGAYLKGAGTSAITAQTGIPAEDITSGNLVIARGGTGATTGAGLVPVIPTSVTLGSGSSSTSANGMVTFTGSTYVDLFGAFTSTYKNYLVQVEVTAGTDTNSPLLFQFGDASTIQAGTSYAFASHYYNTGGGTGIFSFSGGSAGAPVAQLGNYASGRRVQSSVQIFNPQIVALTEYTAQSFASYASADAGVNWYGYQGGSANSFSRLRVISGGGNVFTGTVQVFGYRN